MQRTQTSPNSRVRNYVPPDVAGLGETATAGDDLGRHPGRRTGRVAHLGRVPRDLARQTEVGDLQRLVRQIVGVDRLQNQNCQTNDNSLTTDFIEPTICLEVPNC